MKPNTMALLTLAGGLSLAACGSSTAASTAADPAFLNAAPTYGNFSLEMSDSDASPPLAPAGGDPTALVAEGSAASCHPHLFDRTQEIVSRLNHNFNLHLALVADLIASDPSLKTSTSETWERTRNGIDRKLTIAATANADGSTTYAIELNLTSATGTTAKVLFGSATTIPAAGSTLAEEKGSLTYDYDALKTVVTASQASGQATDSFDRLHDPSKPGLHVKRTSTLTFANFVPEFLTGDSDPHGPRNGTYTWLAEPGVGGTFTFADTVVLLCPANPNSLAANTSTVGRWYRTSAGAISARSDATATGGQIPAGDVFMGVTCAQGPSSGSPPEGYWMMKLEDSTSATVQSQTDSNSSDACDPAFGAVPSITSSASDFNFTAAATFPGEW